MSYANDKNIYNHPDFHSMHLTHQIITCGSKTIKNLTLVNDNAFMSVLRNFTALVQFTQYWCTHTHTHTHS